MSDEPSERSRPADPADAEEIEILEVVGVDGESGAAPAEEEVEVVFDEKGEPDEAPPASPEAKEDAASRERLIRLQADFENLKKRIEREREDFYRHATGCLVARLLPVLDGLERALASGSAAAAGEGLRDGVALIHRQLLDELRKEGLRPVEALGQPFDPELHEAVATDASCGLPPGTVVEELRRGYLFHDRLLRPALVRVSVEALPPADGGEGREES